jgi:hypothetical protein
MLYIVPSLGLSWGGVQLPFQTTQRWQSGPMHGTANPENRQFESDPLLHKSI